MSRNPKKIGADAVVAVEKAVNDISHLHPNIYRDDTLPIHDGEIFVYSSDNQTNDNYLGKVLIQVKGTDVSLPSGDTTTYRLTLGDYEAFSKDFGVLYLVVELLDRVPTVYYKSLYPIDLQEIISECQKSNSNSRLIELRALGSNKSSDLGIICNNFLINRAQQAGRQPIDCTNLNSNTKLTINFHTWKDDPIGFLLENNVYPIAEVIPGIHAPIGKASINEIKTTIPEPVAIDGRVFYESYDVTSTKAGDIVHLGKNITINYVERKYRLNMSGTLNQRLNDLSFLKLVIEKKGKFTIGGKESEFDFQDESLAVEDIRTLYKSHKETLDAIEYYGVRCDINLDSCTRDELILLQLLVAHHSCNDAKILEFIPEMFIKLINVANVSIAVLRVGNKVHNFYGPEITKITFSVSFSDDDSSESMIVSPYCLLGKPVILATNFNVESVKNSIIQFPTNEIRNNLCNKFLLTIIQAYDETNNESLYNLALDISDYLLPKLYPIAFINKLQLLKRKRELFCDEMTKLRAMLLEFSEDTERNCSLRCGIYILLGDRDKIIENFNMLPLNLKEEFVHFPLTKLCPVILCLD